MTNENEHGRGFEEAAKSRADHMPGTTAKGRVDPATVDTDEDTGRTPSEGTQQVEGVEDMPRSGTDTPLGDESTGGEAARQALGVDPDQSGGEVPDRSTGNG